MPYRSTGGALYYLLVLTSWLLIVLSDQAIAGSLPVTGSSAPSTLPPNVILILADDLGYGDLGSYGGDIIQTPNLDRMAQRGLRFTDYYAASPLCSPSRAATFSGQFPQRFGLWHNPMANQAPQIMKLEKTAPSLTDVFLSADYKRVHIGKWHLGDALPAAERGFDIYRTPGAAEKNFPGAGEDLHYTAPITSDAIAKIEQCVREGRRFFINLWYLSPHSPLVDPPEATPFDAYYDSVFGNAGSQKKSYAKMVSYLDAQIGRILDYLDSKGLSQSTLVLFASDNGGTQYGAPLYSNGPYKLGKTSVFEGGVRSPLIGQWIGHIPAGAVSTSPIHGVDLLPTLAELLGVPSNGAGWDGISVLDELMDPRSRVAPRSLHWQVKGVVPALDQGDWTGPTDHWAIQQIVAESGEISRWKLLYDTRWGYRLFDLARDPREARNLLGLKPNSASLRKRDELAAEHLAWKLDVGTVPMTNALEGDVLQSGREYLFSGQGSVRLAQDSRTDVAENLSFSLVVKPSGLPPSTVPVLSKSRSWVLSLRPDLRLYLTMNWVPDMTEQTVTNEELRKVSLVSGHALKVGEPNRVILTFHTYAQSDQAGTLVRLYINGNESRVFVCDANQVRPGGTIFAYDGSQVKLGGQGFTGMIGDLSIFNHALDSADVQWILNRDQCSPTFSPGQPDFDGDEIIDQCDSDYDGDKVPDHLDTFPIPDAVMPSRNGWLAILGGTQVAQ